MKKKIRLFLAVLILAISISILAWGYAPNPREVQTRNIQPVEMQLQTPVPLLP